MATTVQIRDELGAGALSVALVSPHAQRLSAAAKALALHANCKVLEFTSYPPSLDHVSYMLKGEFDAVLVDLDSDPEYALDVVETIAQIGSAIVMVFSEKTDPAMMMRCMRAGAREFLTLPFDQRTIADALVWASARGQATAAPRKTDGKLQIFLGAKGGSGVTMLACNFAVSLAQESGKKTLLIDLNLPLGDAAINLGITPEFTTLDALENIGRLDPVFLATMLTQCDSGLYVLAAPDRLTPAQVSTDGIDSLLEVALQTFDYVVVDAGRKFNLWRTKFFDESATIYLVTQLGIAELRNANRLIAQISMHGGPNLEVVINRYDPDFPELADREVTKALTMPARWRIPNNYAAVQRMQNTARPLALEDSSISRAVSRMARSVCKKPDTPQKKKWFRFLT
jgi:pilus assembly protein CpaE